MITTPHHHHHCEDTFIAQRDTIFLIATFSFETKRIESNNNQVIDLYGKVKVIITFSGIELKGKYSGKIITNIHS